MEQDPRALAEPVELKTAVAAEPVDAQEADRDFRRATAAPGLARACSEIAPATRRLMRLISIVYSKSDVLVRTLEVPCPRATGSASTAPSQTLKGWLPTTSWPVRRSGGPARGRSDLR